MGHIVDEVILHFRQFLLTKDGCNGVGKGIDNDDDEDYGDQKHSP
jgi:hypothetical protein